MEKFTTITSHACVMPEENIDTDQIIPARFLKVTAREGIGNNLFFDKRFDAKGNEIKEFSLFGYSPDIKILIAGKNFGCGSSREHAAWALYDFGFRVVISSFFADIFKNNALNIGLLPVQLSDTFINEMINNKGKKFLLEVDLEKQTVTNNQNGRSEKFELNPFKKHCLLNGQDNVEVLLSLQDTISEFENKKNKKEIYI